LQVDFNQVAEKCGQKYPKNARSAAKNLWAKLKAAGGTAATASVTSPSGAAAARADTPEGSDDEAEGSAKKTLKSPAKSPAKKGTAKATPAKKGVGRTTTPKKAGDVKKTPAKATKAKKVVKSEDVAADEDEEMIEVDSSAAKKEDTEEDPEGLSTFPFQHSEDTHVAVLIRGLKPPLSLRMFHQRISVRLQLCQLEFLSLHSRPLKPTLQLPRTMVSLLRTTWLGKLRTITTSGTPRMFSPNRPPSVRQLREKHPRYFNQTTERSFTDLSPYTD
jgi:hypothetical protein